MEHTPQQAAGMLDGPIPGQSLTSDPKSPKPWETAPDYTAVEEFIDDLFMNLTKEDNLDGVLDSLRQGVPVEDVAQLLLFQAMSSGKITTDLVLLSVEPTMYLLIGLGTFAEVEDMVLYPEDDMEYDADEETNAMEEELDGKEVSIDNLEAPEGISQSLLAKIKDGDI